MVVQAMLHTMATIKCRRSKGYKQETKQVVTTVTGQDDIRVCGLFVFYIFLHGWGWGMFWSPHRLTQICCRYQLFCRALWGNWKDAFSINNHLFSCLVSVHYIATYSANAFHFPIFTLTLFTQVKNHQLNLKTFQAIVVFLFYFSISITQPSQCWLLK